MWSSVNACFELVGSVLAWRNVVEASRVTPKGVYVPMVLFSAAWGLESVPYYLDHTDPTSAVCAAARCLAHGVWCVLALRGRP